ncbi:MAG: membrane protein insertion efficiency factor YidD [Sulfurospirillaceae bacterium]|jgi:putative membrane protein insertion efficiency factor|nr:membrane protein insertion efficiency factor YidD [Sulfurospirillaceae bacterium]MCK9546371.1 membrane protein insertion efficiency factor YidD [Sulfurospirillaceae bacterium]MDY0237285.1 membrane protein insertion efficiency factor YidD [Campylobacterales bacterium]NLM99326.1 membrane protein insertion efficiency factor YidD [Campylobacteraceae bacterium]
MLKKIGLKSIFFYQKVISVFSFGSCRYYPTCSEYAKWQVMHNNFFKALYYSFLRVLKCNQLFPGGFNYPLVKRKFNHHSFIKSFQNKTKIQIFFWFIPSKEDEYIVIRSFANLK